MRGDPSYIDINSDLGEGVGDDAAIMSLISSCNVACGGHHGDAESIKDTISLAKKFGVRIGAHPSFPDKMYFGRRVLTMTKEELKHSLIEQLRLFYEVCEEEQTKINHIKLHGALYNYAAKDAPTADAVLEAILHVGPRYTLYVPYGSVLHRKTENLLPLKFEAFIDRRYADDLSLSDRSLEGSIISSPEDAWSQLWSMVNEGVVVTLEGKRKEITASTFCIHGDHPNSLAILNYIRTQMSKYNIFLEE